MIASLQKKRHSGPVSGRRQGSTVKTRSRAEAGGKKSHSYKLLPTQFQQGPFCYWQVAREDDLAIYEQTWKGKKDSAAFEVIRIRRHDGFQVGDRLVEPGEVYPKSEAWGMDGWTMLSRDAAFTKLREVANDH